MAHPHRLIGMIPLVNKHLSAPPGSDFSSHLQTERRTVLAHIYWSLEKRVLSASRAEIYCSQVFAFCMPCPSATRAAVHQEPLADLFTTVSILAVQDRWRVLAQVMLHIMTFITHYGVRNRSICCSAAQTLCCYFSFQIVAPNSLLSI